MAIIYQRILIATAFFGKKPIFLLLINVMSRVVGFVFLGFIFLF